MSGSEGEKEGRKDMKQRVNAYAKYSAMGVQMGLIIGASAWLGQYLDELNEMETPLFTLGLSLVGVALALYFVLKDFIKK